MSALSLTAIPRPVAQRAPLGALRVPVDFQDRLDTAVRAGQADARTFADEHGPEERWMVPDWALSRMGWPPKTDVEDLAYLHKLSRARTTEGVAAAAYWADHGLNDEWEQLLGAYLAQAGPRQARAARKLLHDTLMMTNAITQTAKAATMRTRPFVVDPTLKLAVRRPGNNPSYPSGHTSAAFAACLVLAHLMPDRAGEFLQMAGEASFARVYGGVHFPTDVIAGAKLAATIAGYLTSVSDAVPILGTAGFNTGVTGTRRRPLPGAVRLSGQPIAR